MATKNSVIGYVNASLRFMGVPQAYEAGEGAAAFPVSDHLELKMGKLGEYIVKRPKIVINITVKDPILSGSQKKKTFFQEIIEIEP